MKLSESVEMDACYFKTFTTSPKAKQHDLAPAYLCDLLDKLLFST